MIIGTFCEKCRQVKCVCDPIKKESVTKPIKAKPHFYAHCFESLMQIAKDMGYNLVIHGSMARDMDLIAIAWTNETKTHIELLQAFCDHLGVPKFDDVAHYLHSLLPGGRDNYIINLNRGGRFNGYLDAQYYLDISFTPIKKW